MGRADAARRGRWAERLLSELLRLPFQDLASGNHIAQWVTRVVRQGCADSTQCEGSEQCIETVCRPAIK